MAAVITGPIVLNTEGPVDTANGSAIWRRKLDISWIRLIPPIYPPFILGFIPLPQTCFEERRRPKTTLILILQAFRYARISAKCVRDQ